MQQTGEARKPYVLPSSHRYSTRRMAPPFFIFEGESQQGKRLAGLDFGYFPGFHAREWRKPDFPRFVSALGQHSLFQQSGPVNAGRLRGKTAVGQLQRYCGQACW